MTVTELTRLDVSNMTFDLIDTAQRGYMNKNAKVLFSGDKNAYRVQYGRSEVMSFEPRTARRMALYIKVVD